MNLTHVQAQVWETAELEKTSQNMENNNKKSGSTTIQLWDHQLGFSTERI